MSAVNPWKTKKPQPHTWVTDLRSQWHFVGIAENNALIGWSAI